MSRTEQQIIGQKVFAIFKEEHDKERTIYIYVYIYTTYIYIYIYVWFAPILIRDTKQYI